MFCLKPSSAVSQQKDHLHLPGLETLQVQWKKNMFYQVNFEEITHHYCTVQATFWSLLYYVWLTKCVVIMMPTPYANI